MTDLDRQLETNRETLQALRDNGVRDGESVEVDAFFFAADETSAAALVADLTANGWRARSDREKQGVFRKRTVWSVQGSRSVTADDDAVDAMVERLDVLANKHSATFDGWGAEVPGDQ